MTRFIQTDTNTVFNIDEVEKIEFGRYTSIVSLKNGLDINTDYLSKEDLADVIPNNNHNLVHVYYQDADWNADGVYMVLYPIIGWWRTTYPWLAPVTINGFQPCDSIILDTSTNQWLVCEGANGSVDGLMDYIYSELEVKLRQLTLVE